jgi:hypothetical protein
MSAGRHPTGKLCPRFRAGGLNSDTASAVTGRSCPAGRPDRGPADPRKTAVSRTVKATPHRATALAGSRLADTDPARLVLHQARAAAKKAQQQRCQRPAPRGRLPSARCAGRAIESRPVVDMARAWWAASQHANVKLRLFTEAVTATATGKPMPAHVRRPCSHEGWGLNSGRLGSRGDACREGPSTPGEVKAVLPQSPWAVHRCDGAEIDVGLSRKPSRLPKWPPTAG